LNQVIGAYKRNAKTKGLEFFLTYTEMDVLLTGNCAYCGAEPNQVAKKENLFGKFLYTRIDRTDDTIAMFQGILLPAASNAIEQKA
jgi:hypothetical protein